MESPKKPTTKGILSEVRLIPVFRYYVIGNTVIANPVRNPNLPLGKFGFNKMGVTNVKVRVRGVSQICRKCSRPLISYLLLGYLHNIFLS